MTPPLDPNPNSFHVGPFKNPLTGMLYPYGYIPYVGREEFNELEIKFNELEIKFNKILELLGSKNDND